jgi:PAS domain S-box-containing protein
MKVSSIVIPVEQLSINDTISTAISLMYSKNVDIVPVSDQQKGLIGALTRTDLLTALQSGMPMTGTLEGHLSDRTANLSMDEEVEGIPVSAIPSLVIGEGGAVIGVVSMEAYVAALQVTNSKFRQQVSSIMDSAGSGLIAVNERGTIIAINRMAEELLGSRTSESMGRNILEVIPNTRLMDIMKSGKSLMGQKFEGQNVSLLVNYAPIILEGKVVGAVSVFQDISVLEEISHELDVVKGLNRELEAIIHSSYDGIWITDGEGLALDINEAYERITGILAKEVIGRKMQDLVDEGYFDQSVTLLVMKKLKSVTINQTIRGKKQILVTGNPIFDENGKLFRVVTNVRDVTELTNLHEQITQEKEQTLKYKTELSRLRSMQIKDSDLIFRSGLMMQIVELTMKMADVDSTVLITGESGTGKELIAKLIHRQGKGDTSPFISINCAAIPEQLLESELFGYEGGAFTGAKKEGKPGLFEMAHTGTLFLDEVAELPLPLQVKILRAIQDKEITRLGATKSIPIDVRIIAATNRNLSKMLKEGTFREDLYYRLMVVPVNVSPLRDRKEDIPLLVRHFLDEFNRHFGFSKVISPQVLDKLENYSWPGNVRELRNVIERMVVMSQGDEITPNDLPGFIHIKLPLYRQGARLKDAVCETETYLLSETYKTCGSWQETAKILGVDRATVFRKAAKYHLLEK